MYDVSSDIASVVAPAAWAPVPNPVERGGWLAVPARDAGYRVLDCSGRVVDEIAPMQSGTRTDHWPAGVVFVVDRASGKAARALVVD
jgi:hypothetical protein